MKRTPLDPEVAFLLLREREWEKKEAQIVAQDWKAMIRCLRYSLLICTPFWVAFCWWMSR